jgi:hypothetical protein
LATYLIMKFSTRTEILFRSRSREKNEGVDFRKKLVSNILQLIFTLFFTLHSLFCSYSIIYKIVVAQLGPQMETKKRQKTVSLKNFKRPGSEMNLASFFKMHVAMEESNSSDPDIH